TLPLAGAHAAPRRRQYVGLRSQSLHFGRSSPPSQHASRLARGGAVSNCADCADCTDCVFSGGNSICLPCPVGAVSAVGAVGHCLPELLRLSSQIVRRGKPADWQVMPSRCRARFKASALWPALCPSRFTSAESARWSGWLAK